MAGLNFTQAVWDIGSFTLGAGQSQEFAIVYPGPGSVMSFNSLNTDIAINQRFSYQTTGIVIHGFNLDVPSTDTTYFVTVTNQSADIGEFSFVLQALYY
jgi:hypothetical protein